MGIVSYTITTYTGKDINPWHLEVDQIDILDIAHALGNTCRYGGHCRSFYSVAQHSVLVSRACSPQFALWGLLHDASEAYLMDLPAPFKVGGSLMANEYMLAEQRAMRVIAERFDLVPKEQPGIVHTADRMVLWAEMKVLMPQNDDARTSASRMPADVIRMDPPRTILNSDAAKAMFISEFNFLTRP